MNGSAEQLPTWKRLATFAIAPWIELICPPTLLAEQLVGLNVKPGRSTLTSTSRTCSGIPSSSVGSGSETILSSAVLRSTKIAARTTTVPRFNGPATAGTTIESPNGAPLYGPVMYTRPGSVNGFDPAPAAVVTEPIFESSPQLPAAAWPSLQRLTLAIRASKPLGILTVTPPSSWSSSVRENPTTNGESFPPTGLTVPALNVGLKPIAGHGAPLPSYETSNEVWIVTGVVPLHGVSTAVVVAGPQVRGSDSGARGPVLKWSDSFENGSCGLLSKVAVTVLPFVSIRPGSLIVTPGPLATR